MDADSCFCAQIEQYMGQGARWQAEGLLRSNRGLLVVSAEF
jgi:hypothetical protein